MQTERFGYDARVPEDIRDMFVELCGDVVALRQKWDFYKTLFAQDNLSVLTNLAVGSTQVMEETLRDSMTMAICRLSDPPQTSHQDNLTLRTLVQFQSSIPNLVTLERDFLTACDPVRRLRNKRVGHNDLNTRLEPHTNPLPGISRGQIDRIIELAETILNTVIQQYASVDLRFELSYQGDAEALLFWLRLADKHKDDR